ncbi:MAG: mercuric reductase [Cyanobacteria bacterium]|nr:mercuric reductase [Cyanobacteriota bacterium]
MATVNGEFEGIFEDGDRALELAVRPPDWVNPVAGDRYDLIAIGGGTAGLVAAAGAAGLGLGLRVALIERDRLGGDCLNVGCVPSKALIRSARVVGDLRRGAGLGVTADGVAVDFERVMGRLRAVRGAIAPHDSAQRFTALGVDVFFGEAQFVGRDAIAVGGQTLRFKKAVIATGGRAARPEIDGLEAVGYHTNATIFEIRDRPDRLAVIGGGPIGCELAQTFQRLGSQVTLFQRASQLLPKEEAAAAAIVQTALQEDGVNLLLETQPHRAEITATGEKLLHYRRADGTDAAIAVDAILLAAGRVPNVEGLNLGAAGVDHDPSGVRVNDFLQTSNPKIFAAGDICMAWKFTHAADAAARIVLKNALFAPLGLGRSRLSSLTIPWVTFTDPEVARVGLSETEAQAQGRAIGVITINLADVDRARTDGETDGFLKIIHAAGGDRILGATLVSRHAGETISELTTAIVGGIGLGQLASVIHPYPTQADCIKKAADAYRRTLLKPRTRTLLRWLSRLS